MTPEYSHACFNLGLVAGVALCIGIACAFGLLFIAANALTDSDWTRTPGRVIEGWRRR